MQDLDLKDKRVIIRVDFNVPMKEGIITNDARIRAEIPTLELAQKKGPEFSFYLIWAGQKRALIQRNFPCAR